MIVIEISLWPGGDFEHAKTLAAGIISNDGTGNSIVGNYDVVFSEQDGAKFEGRVDGHWRGNGVLELVKKALNNMLEVVEGEEDGPE